MGYLTVTTSQTYNYEESRPLQKRSKLLAIKQFIKLFIGNRNYKSKADSHWLNGYEQEVFILKEEPGGENNGRTGYVLDRKAGSVFDKDTTNQYYDPKCETLCFHVEIVPNSPFHFFLDMKPVFEHLLSSFQHLDSCLDKGSMVYSSSHYHDFGTSRSIGSSELTEEDDEKKTQDPEFWATKHPRYLTTNNRLNERRGDKPQIVLPVFEDKLTKKVGGEQNATLESYFSGFSVCSVQMTYATRDIEEATWLHDQFHILAPYFVSHFLVSKRVLAGTFCWNTDPKIEVAKQRYEV